MVQTRIMASASFLADVPISSVQSLVFPLLMRKEEQSIGINVPLFNIWHLHTKNRCDIVRNEDGYKSTEPHHDFSPLVL